MKKQKIFSVLLLLIPGLCGGFLRGTEMAYYFDWSTAMFIHYKMDFIMPVAVGLILLIWAFLSMGYRKKLKDYCTAWKTQGKGGLTVGILSASLLLLMGVARIYLSLSPMRKSYVIFGILTVLAGITLILLSVARYCGRLPAMTRLLSSLTVFWSCFLLVLTYMEHPVEPSLRVFCYDILAACFITLALFYEIATIFEHKSQRLALFFNISASYMIIMTVTGRLFAYLLSGDIRNLTDAPVRMLMFFAIGIRLIQNAFCLLNRSDEQEKKNSISSAQTLKNASDAEKSENDKDETKSDVDILYETDVIDSINILSEADIKNSLDILCEADESDDKKTTDTAEAQ